MGSYDDGGPAFPSVAGYGMSLRDYFAIRSLGEARIQIIEKFGIDHMNTMAVVGEAYLIADAMIAARREPSSKEATAVEMLKALKRIRDRVDELETDNHDAVAFEELRGLQEEAADAIQNAEDAGLKE